MGNKPFEGEHESNKIMALEEYRSIIDKIHKCLILVILYDEGEPLLHKDIFKMVRYNSQFNISSSISTNFSFPFPEERVKDILSCGLDRLIVAVDGDTQEIYAKYRKGGDVGLVKENVSRLVVERNKRGLKKPAIEIQYLDFGYNSHQVKAVKRFSQNVGADFFSTFKADYDGKEEFRGTMHDRIRLGCAYLWTSLDISSDLLIFPCDFGEDHGMPSTGSLLDMGTNDYWNSPEMVSLRKGFSRKSKSFPVSQCSKCPEREALPRILR